MISLQSHNQVLYHLTQLTSTFTPRTSSISTRIQRHDDGVQASPGDLCPESLHEAAKNCAETELNKDLVIHLGSGLPKFRRSLEELSLGRVTRPLKNCSVWNVSYVSGKCFAENKRDFLCSPISEPIILPVIRCTLERGRATRRNGSCYNASYLPRDIWTRGFKTDRNIKAEVDRNPTIVARLKQWMGVSKSTHEVSKNTHRTKEKVFLFDDEAGLTMGGGKVGVRIFGGCESGLWIRGDLRLDLLLRGED